MVPMQGGDGNNWRKKIDEWFTIRQIRQSFPPPIFSHARYTDGHSILLKPSITFGHHHNYTTWALSLYANVIY